MHVMDWQGYRQQVLAGVSEIGKLSGETVRGYVQLGSAGGKTNHLDAKTRELIALACAVTLRCDGCITVHSDQALKLGATRAELAEALGVAIALNAGAALVCSTCTLGVIDPTRGAVFTHAPRADHAQAEQAVSAAKAALRPWAALGYDGRRPYIERLADAMTANRDYIAQTLTREHGGPIADCHVEVERATAAVRYFAGQKLEDRVVREDAHELIIEQRYPQGVVVAIMPWNRPLTLLAFKLGPALITGNTVVIKPAPTTPLSTLIIGELAAEIFPAGVVQTLVDQNDLGSLLTRHPDVVHVSFTGSTPTGKKVLAAAADTLKRFTLELGGNDAAIVLDDADPEWTADHIFASAMINAGQLCYAAKRVYAPRHLYDPLSEALA